MRIFGLIGKTLGHSWSRRYFENKFRTEQLTDCLYENFPMEDVSGIRSMVSQNPSIIGLNVTWPFKEKVISYLDLLSPEARTIQAVNCILVHRTNGPVILEGINTDSPAFLSTLAPFLYLDIKRALVLGTGGAAKAVAHALDIAGIDPSMVSRSSGKACYVYHDLTKDIIKEHTLIVNATPAGMPGFEVICPPIPYEALNKHHILYDLVYNPSETIFLSRGKMAGAVALNGLEMLKIQAELSWAAWNA